MNIEVLECDIWLSHHSDLNDEDVKNQEKVAYGIEILRKAS